MMMENEFFNTVGRWWTGGLGILSDIYPERVRRPIAILAITVKKIVGCKWV